MGLAHDCPNQEMFYGLLHLSTIVLRLREFSGVGGALLASAHWKPVPYLPIRDDNQNVSRQPNGLWDIQTQGQESLWVSVATFE